MPNILLTYDLKKDPEDIHTKVKVAMKARGYADAAKCGTSLHNLPNTTLAGFNKTIEQSIKDLKDCVNEINPAALERYISVEVVSCSNWSIPTIVRR